jgi:hypothetical protein
MDMERMEHMGLRDLMDMERMERMEHMERRRGWNDMERIKTMGSPTHFSILALLNVSMVPHALDVDRISMIPMRST